jgi:hypothetical protein
VSTHAGKAQKGTYDLEKTANSYTHDSVGHSSVEFLV